jgi:hypothetical protein
MFENKTALRLAAVLAGFGLAGTSQAAFQDPATAAWGGWTRGDAGTVYAGWNIFTDDADPGIVDTSPDVPASTLIGGGTTGGPAVGSIGTGPFRVTEAGTPGTFLTSGGNIYNPSFATAFTVEVGGVAESGPVRLALQVRTQGDELDYGAVTVNGTAFDTRTELERAALGGFGGAMVDSLFVWTLAAGSNLYSFEFGAASSSLSLDALTVDVAPVPLPAPVLLLGSALAGLAAMRRRAVGVAA